MANKDAINRVNCGGHCCSKRVGSIMLEAETKEGRLPGMDCD